MKNKIKLKELKVKDVTKEYVSWMNDKDIIRFTEISKRQLLTAVRFQTVPVSRSRFGSWAS